MPCCELWEGGSETAYGLFQKLNKLSRELKVKVEQFKRTMPLLSDLRNPALRERYGSAEGPICTRFAGPLESG
ncbi:alpha-actinin-4 [Platysternon megacephalum]|uniref:Alpha-actinin-4 n=1 Tax=Platysternon megacephalum TaxID=55544 RepID=A0A4D9DUL0_9SAUR|nr:alpha-actinin-4 [Platysternon megacephalum]